MARSRLIMLNGTSSSGKTSLARALQEVLDEPYMIFSSDILEEHIHARFTVEWEQLRLFLPALLQGHFHCMRALVTTGNWVVADVVLEEEALVAEAVKALWDQEAFLLGVHCNAAELARREKERGDRSVGMAQGQLERVHAHGIYDFEVDTTAIPALDCARQIAEFLAADPKPQAFVRMKAERGIDPADPTFVLDW
ncbi:MAG: chloramphenicol phosphotransferase [Candidatus Latescibacteria bacterium]|nr:chloramphenicol phosphotransferase [Candidatus Latescibacterota bacterium]